jgi:hypothetical protein
VLAEGGRAGVLNAGLAELERVSGLWSSLRRLGEKGNVRLGSVSSLSVVCSASVGGWSNISASSSSWLSPA